MWKPFALIASIVFFIPWASWADGKPSDDEISRTIVGSWINPPDSSDYRGKPEREVFRDDGSYTYYLYRDRDCKVVIEQVEVKWSVKDAVLTSIAPNGMVMRDEVVSIGPQRMTLHSLDDGSTYVRERSKACSEVRS
jgi:hypothetical protein